MKPDILNNMVKISSSKQDNIVSFDDELNEFKDSDISIQSIKDLILKANTLIDHINNNNAHISNQERANFASILNTYTTYENLYVSKNDRINWNGKETPAGSQQKADIVQDNLDKHIYNDDIHVTKKLKLLWNDKYTRNEIDNKFSWIMYDTVYLDAVLTYTDIATTYPNPNKKDTVYVADTGITYRYNGIKWITLSINLIPLATADFESIGNSALVTE
jgi:hypothetical protein